MMAWLTVMMVAGVLTATSLAWVTAATRWFRGMPLLVCEARRPNPWGLLDIAMTFFCLLVLFGVAMQVLVAWFGLQPGTAFRDSSVRQQTLLMLAESLVSGATLVFSVAFIRLRTGASWRDLGLVPGKLGSDLRIGITAFVMLAPLVYLLQWILVQWFESKHPLVELLKREPDPRTIGIGILSAVCIAPLAEEFFFRGLLQGWLEQLARKKTSDWAWLLGCGVGKPDWTRHDGPPAAAVADHATAWSETTELNGADETEWRDDQAELLAHAKSLTDSLPPPDLSSSDNELVHDNDAVECQAVWPVVASSLVFALLHYSHGPDWVPLFFLAIGLGYLYRQTHRIVPGIVVHFLLNAFSMGMFLVEVLG